VRRVEKGFSFLELVAVVILVALLIAVAMNRMLVVQAAAERVAMESVVGALRSAVGMKLAEYLVSSDLAGARALVGSNPMDQLSQVPANYRGAVRNPDWRNAERGSWYFDAGAGNLVYVVNNGDYFSGGLSKPARIRFAVELQYARNARERRGSPRARDVVGVQLVALEPYAWAVTPEGARREAERTRQD
jgi:type II secretory pathway pseudopilin PulG